MRLAEASLAALAAAILVSCTVRLNVGLLAVALAWLVGVYYGGMRLEEVAAGFPSQLFLTLVGVTLLFAQAHWNGTLDRVAQKALRLCRGNVGLTPLAFFALALILSVVGPGTIASAALVAPAAMAVAARAGVPAFLMAIMVGNGANAGALSPFAPTGIIVNSLMAQVGLGGNEWRTCLYVMAAHSTVGIVGYFVFGGWRLFRRGSVAVESESGALENRHWLTLAVIACLIIAVAFFNVNVGMGAFVGAIVLGLLRTADPQEALKSIPWSVIVMVCGVTVLVALAEKAHGLDLVTDALGTISSRRSMAALIGFLAGLVSMFSSTSGVVLPAFVPMAPGLAARVGADPLAVASAINVGANLVDVSPLSTIGALCLSAAQVDGERLLFQKLLAWGLSMTVVGAGLCHVFFGGR